MEKDQTNNQLKSLILEVATNEKPENTEKLKQLMQKEHGISPELTDQIILELENEGNLLFAKPETLTQISAPRDVFSAKALWYWITLVLSVIAAFSVLTISEATYPISYLRNVFGILFLFFLPGFAFTKAFFPRAVPIKTSSDSLDNIERVALSLGISLVLVPLVGLILINTPWGNGLTSVTLSLLTVTVAVATVALLRE